MGSEARCAGTCRQQRRPILADWEAAGSSWRGREGLAHLVSQPQLLQGPSSSPRQEAGRGGDRCPPLLTAGSSEPHLG